MNDIAPLFHDSPTQRTPCMLVLDASGSMSSPVPGQSQTRMDELNRGLKLLKEELREDETACMRVQLAIVCVGGPSHSSKLILDWTDAQDFEPPVLRADGPTPLAQGMRLALHHVDRHKVELNRHGIAYTRPWVMVMSDGEPSDPPEVWKGVTEECRAAERGKRCVIYPIAVEGGNPEVLQQLSSTPVARLSSTRFKQYFQWLSASLQCVSRSRAGESVALPAPNPWAVFP
jgi:uncharacterized protein YegL